MAAIRRNDVVRDVILRQLLQLDGGRFARDLTWPEALIPLERRRVTEYVGGITRHRRWLDFVIDHFSTARSELQPLLRQALRIGVYELLEMDNGLTDALRRNDLSSFVAQASQKSSYVPLVDCALDYAISGVTSLEEVVRVAGDSNESRDSSRLRRYQGHL